ncbi:MAG: flavin reductase family protein [Chloroflexota bacterium]|nr:MAG: flavin reductase family protein [Chloroflexota bacterium]
MSNDSIKDVLKVMPYGFYAITSRFGDDMNVMVANWISQVSFDPRLVAIGLQKTSYTHRLIEKGGVFAINIFRTEDQEAMMPFTKGRSKDPDKMKDADYSISPEVGCPVLRDAAAYIEFRVSHVVDIGGDHDIVVGAPVGAEVLKPAEANEVLTLAHLGWSYAG